MHSTAVSRENMSFFFRKSEHCMQLRQKMKHSCLSVFAQVECIASLLEEERHFPSKWL